MSRRFGLKTKMNQIEHELVFQIGSRKNKTLRNGIFHHLLVCSHSVWFTDLRREMLETCVRIARDILVSLNF